MFPIKKVVTFRADRTEIKVMRQAARKERLRFSTWIRQTCLKAAELLREKAS